MEASASLGDQRVRRLETQDSQCDVVEGCCKNCRSPGRMQAPTTIFVYRAHQIAYNLGLPLWGNLRLGNIHSDHYASQQEARTTIRTAPMTIIQLETLIEPESIASGFLEIAWCGKPR
jgi:hypothetical protein